MKAPPRARPAAHDTAIDPRIRARRAEVLRSEARRRLRVALTVLAAVLLVAAGWLLLHSRLFSARVVTVVGAVHTPVAQVIDAAGLADHPPLLDVGPAAAAGVERLPWVAGATVVREWPDGVRITVRERVPVGIVEEAGTPPRWAVVDRRGTVLAVTGRPPPLPRVVASTRPGTPGSVVPHLGAALRVAATLPPAFRAQVASVSEDRAGDVTLKLTSALTVYLGSTVNLHEKYEDVAAILAGAALQAGSTLDVAAPATPVVRP